jgi:argininosuccinate lyase
MMPQKKNPDVAELTRAKTGRVFGALVALLTVVKGLPLSYNRDLQEDKEPLFDSVDSVTAMLEVLAAMVPQIVFDREAMRAAAGRGHSTATDLADYLVRRGVPFRDAHAAVGRIVAEADAEGLELAQVPLDRLRRACAEIDADVLDVLTLEGSVNARDHVGGTAPAQVRAAAARARQRLSGNQRKRNHP